MVLREPDRVSLLGDRNNNSVRKPTIYEWLQEPGFQAAYRLARREVFVAAVSRLQQVSGEAVETLREVMTEKTQQGAACVGAAKAVLNYAIKATEQEQIVERIEDLERRAARVGLLRREVA